MDAETLELMTTEYKSDLQTNLLILRNGFENYPALQKFFNAVRSEKLEELINLFLQRNSYAVIDDHSGKVWYACQYRRLEASLTGTAKTWHSLIILLEVFGLIERYHKNHSSNLTKIREQAIKAYTVCKRPVSWFYCPLWTGELLANAESKAAVWVSKGHYSGLSKAMIISLYGQETANQIYSDNRTETDKNSKAIARINIAFKESVSAKGYATKRELIDINSKYEQAIFNRWIAQAQVRYGQATKQQRELLGIKPSWIITPIDIGEA